MKTVEFVSGFLFRVYSASHSEPVLVSAQTRKCWRGCQYILCKYDAQLEYNGATVSAFTVEVTSPNGVVIHRSYWSNEYAAKSMFESVVVTPNMKVVF